MTPAPTQVTVRTSAGVDRGRVMRARLQVRGSRGASSGVATRGAHRLDDRPRALDELRVGGLDALAQVEVVLQPDADVPAEQHRLRDPRHLHPAERERRPDRVVGQLVDHRREQRRVGGCAVRDVHAELEHRRRVDQPLLDQLAAEPQVAGVEDLHLDAHAELLDALGAVAQDVRRADVDQAALAEVEAAAVERADVGQQLLDVREPLDAVDQVGALDERASGRCGSSTRSPPMPAVVLMMTSTSLARMRSTASR